MSDTVTSTPISAAPPANSGDEGNSTTSPAREDSRELHRSDMASGQLAALIAHELNTPLQAICNLLYLAEQRVGAPESYIPQVRAEIDRLSQFMDRLLRFAQPDAPRGEVDANELLERALALLAPLLARHRLVVVRDLASLPPVFGDPGSLAQLIFDLLVSLVDKAEGETLWVRSHLHPSASGPAVCLRLSVERHGRPPLPDDLARQSQGESVVLPGGIEPVSGWDVLERHRGSLWVATQRGRASAVTLVLPASSSQLGDLAQILLQ